MSEYTKSDFYYCLDRAPLGAFPKRVIRAWGISGRQYADWRGGFVVELADGKHAYVSGWSDSSGWG